MNSKDIQSKLNELGYNESIIRIMNNGFKLTISGSVHIQEIKDNFNVTKWEFKGNKAMFDIGK